MATYERYMNAARNADAAGDEAAARQLVQAAMAARSQTTQEPEAERAESFLVALARLVDLR